MRLAIISGVSGQDGSLLADLLLEKQYFVIGIISKRGLQASISGSFGSLSSEVTGLLHQPRQPQSQTATGALEISSEEAAKPDEEKKYLEMEFDFASDEDGTIDDLLHTICFTNAQTSVAFQAAPVVELYHLAGFTNVRKASGLAEQAVVLNSFSTMRLCGAIMKVPELASKARVFQACSSEMYGHSMNTTLVADEKTPFAPVNVYGASKLLSYITIKEYRQRHGLFCCSGILFNHESERRRDEFVTRKITYSLSLWLKHELPFVQLGDIDSRKDWGYARDFVYGMWLMLQQRELRQQTVEGVEHEVQDYVLATSASHSVRDFVECAFACKGIELVWVRDEQEQFEIATDKATGRVAVKASLLPLDHCSPDRLPFVGNSEKAQRELGWRHTKSFEQLVALMVASDCS